MGQGGQRQPPVELGCRIPQPVGGQAVGQLVDRQADQAGRAAHQEEKHTHPVHVFDQSGQRAHCRFPLHWNQNHFIITISSGIDKAEL